MYKRQAPISNDSVCEEHFVKSTHRNDEGRFVVSLPFESDNPQLGESYATACLSQSSEPNLFSPFLPSNLSSPECSAEEKQTPKLSLISTLPIDLSKDFSSLHRLTRVYAYCFRFIKNTRPSRAEKISGVLTPAEIHSTLNFFIKQSQSIHFAAELNCLRNGASVSIRSKLSSLNPFLDEFGVIRVGGRLQQSQLPYDNKHPIVLHPSAHITRLIIECEHIRLLHAGAQLVHHSLRQRW